MDNMKLEQNFAKNNDIISAFDKAITNHVWNKHALLKKYKDKLQYLKDTFVKEIDIENYMANENGYRDKKEINRTGQLKVFISLYNPDGGDLDKWSQIIHGIVENVISRPVYRVEDDIKSAITSQNKQENEGYVIVYVNNIDLIDNSKSNESQDSLGNELSFLRKNCIKKDNIVEFVYDSQHYVIKEKKLIPIEMI
ncbi:MAG: Dot/Icm secretion system protein IcmQ [Legionellales bacterium]|nr:Dot/Icm secretion system protein IcmQ [Legionellales bacterium]